MQKRLGLTLFAGLAIFVAACTGGGASAAPSAAPSTATVDRCVGAPSEAPSSGLRSALVHSDQDRRRDRRRDGQRQELQRVHVRRRQEWRGGDRRRGASRHRAEGQLGVRDAGIQAYVDQGYDIIVTAGFNLGVATTKAAHDNPDIWFIGVDQGPPCVNEEGLPDTTFACAGDAATLLPKYVAISYQEDQAGYLAGMVAASVKRDRRPSAPSAASPSAARAFATSRASSWVPSRSTRTSRSWSAWVTESDFVKAFNDPVTGKSFGQQFHRPELDVDVLFQVAGKTGNGILEAACEAGILGHRRGRRPGPVLPERREVHGHQRHEEARAGRAETTSRRSWTAQAAAATTTGMPRATASGTRPSTSCESTSPR